MDKEAPPPYVSSTSPSSTSPAEPGPSTRSSSSSPQTPASPPEYSAQKRLVLWCAEGGGKQPRRARDLTVDLAPPTVLRKFSLDNQNITHLRHGDDGCSLTPRPLGYILTGKVEMWSATQRTQEYHWGGMACDRAMKWRLVGATDGAHIRRDLHTVVDIVPHQRIHSSRVLAGAREVRTGKPDRDLRAALTAQGGVAVWNVTSAAYLAGEEDTYLSCLPGLDPEAEPSFKILDKTEEGMHWARWATAEVGGGTATRQKRHARNVLDFDVGSIVVALKEGGEVWLCIVDRPDNIRVVARADLVGIYRLASDDDDEPTYNQPVAYVVDLRAGVRVYPIQSGGEGMPFAQLSLQPLVDGYQAAARTPSGEVHAWMRGTCPSTSPSSGNPSALWAPRTPSPTQPSGSRLASHDSQPSTRSSPEVGLGARSETNPNQLDVTICATQVTELVELPHTRDGQLFPVSVGVGCALCVSMELDELGDSSKKRRGLGIMGLGLLGKGKGKKAG
ncbi:uncharacterized protein CcaverHIS019_0211840 [Cutaneotrichosporon cavernicola]|uniref:Uncharacterized protein n=1 Tax=Cutaneotrichosporon cavernicola TaxID=279322 RepID=A0AA48IBM1_9TREE|nr:uncharacterized protein CcaverHIS019_0211840 [Cutaneotrichosporon cavernicola]BEI89822.1 hypothetical protein CcaverHIS019_0211840 [Cutaneotrichosporon cavernicola]BEI97592.1 hypothetical protein CcaverHIS631_0211810 [Cutaneotrichosporon cavernicola]BEJ05371.1 hypothetical protein CcaverHIS641_0211880 [Cutaneotrichosporon cavernicola]